MHETVINRAAQLIKTGKLVAFPTETVYGLGANALDPTAVAKIFEAKKRPFFDPLIVHIASLAMLDELVNEVSPKAKVLIDKFWPGPLTLVMLKKSIVPDLVTAGFNTVAVRMPDHPVALELIRLSNCPIAAPSANPFGRLSPTKAVHVTKYLGQSVDLIIDGGDCKRGLESTIIDVTQEPFKVLRAGALPVESIEAIVGPLMRVKPAQHEVMPGSLPYHYAPRTKFVLLEPGENYPVGNGKIGVLLFGDKDIPLEGITVSRNLSITGDLVEAAANLFGLLHELDESGCEVIYARAIPEQGLGVAIMDRLRKAANTFRA